MVLAGWARFYTRQISTIVRYNSPFCNLERRSCRYLVSFRSYCGNSPHQSPPPPPPPPKRHPCAKLMNFPPLVWPQFFISMKNWIYTYFIIKPHLDSEFNIYKFVENSKQAVEVISNALYENDLNALKELVSEEAYSELYYSLSQLSLAERQNLIIDKRDIFFSFPYQIGIMFNKDDDKRWVEITMVYHILKGFNDMKQRGESLPMNFGVPPQEQVDRLFICNCRFIREYTKGKQDSSWIVNIVNHFREYDFRQNFR